MAVREDFLPVTRADMEARGWDRPDFVYVSGDAYVDHPSFGPAIISRVLEAAGFRVAMLAQPDWRTTDDFRRFGRPRLGFLVSAGNIDSMVAHYTVAKRRRTGDYYSPGGKIGRRPDRAVIVYCNRIREAYGDVPIILGGLEASLRRFAHYDYWEDRMRRSILVDSRADILTYGMGENILRRLAALLDRGVPVRRIRDVRGCVWLGHRGDAVHFDAVECGTYDALREGGEAYARAFAVQYRNQDAITGKAVVEYYDDDKMLVQNPPMPPLETAELDAVYALPYTRTYHPDYEAEGGVPAIEEVRFSIAHNRGCFGSCNFCAITFNQGRAMRARSVDSVLREAKLITEMPDFKGYIHDVGGPTANFRAPACEEQLTRGVCLGRKCLFPKPCPHLRVDHSEYAAMLRKIAALPRVRRVFIRSGIRYDYLMADPDRSFLRQLIEMHVSGQLKVAPEHCAAATLAAMGKPGIGVYEAFKREYFRLSREVGKEQYLVPYLMSSHPGCRMSDAVELALFLKKEGYMPEQVQDFYPTPGTVSTVMYATGIDPLTMKPVYVPRDHHEKQLQRALLQYSRPQNAALVREALVLSGRPDLIGYGPECLVRPEKTPANGTRVSRNGGTDGRTAGNAPRGRGKGSGKSGSGVQYNGAGRPRPEKAGKSAAGKHTAAPRPGEKAKNAGAKKPYPAKARQAANGKGPRGNASAGQAGRGGHKKK